MWCGLFSLKQWPACTQSVSDPCLVWWWLLSRPRPMVSWDNAWEHYPGWRLITCCHQYITNIVIIQHPMSDWHHPQPLHCLAPSLPPLGEFYLDFIEQTFANVDCVGAIYLMTVVTFCCWCPRPLLRTLGQGGWTMHRLLWLLLFPRSNNAHHQLDTTKSRIYGHKMLMLNQRCWICLRVVSAIFSDWWGIKTETEGLRTSEW